MRTSVHPIETESYAILRTRLDTVDLPPLTRAVVERIVHTTADPTWAGDLVCDEDALRAGRAALLAGAPLVTDVRMVAVGVTARTSTVALDLADPAGPPGGTLSAAGTRSAAGIRAAVQRHPDGAVWVIGNAPTALAELVRCAAEGLVRTPLVVGLPVGFVGSVAAKAALRTAGPGASGTAGSGASGTAGSGASGTAGSGSPASGTTGAPSTAGALPSISNRSERGGAAVAAAAVNALLYFEETR